MLGNAAGAAMIEIAIAGGRLRFESDAELCVGGAEANVSLAGAPIERWTAVRAHAGDELDIGPITRGRFLYVGVRGGIDVPVVLGSRSTLISAGFGGYEGRRLAKGDVLVLGEMTVNNGATLPSLAPDVLASEPIAVMHGPQSDLFDSDVWSKFLDSAYRVSIASDRTGVRLDGAALAHRGAADLPSEPACVGAVQVTGGGMPIVLMHDGPTVGGYPKIAVIRERSLSRFAQRAPGDEVRFALEE